MSKAPEPEVAPTMIVPRGTEITVDGHGQLSIRAPGNLVLQNSGRYGSLESVAGSIRIDHGVEVEAVSVRCADTCFVQGSLTAWKVTARSLHVEDSARAHIVLQETGRLEVGREARLVGNFSSEKELFVLFSRFARELRSLPMFERPGALAPSAGLATAPSIELAPSAPAELGSAPAAEAAASPAERAAASLEGAAEVDLPGAPGTPWGRPAPEPSDDLPEPLFFALVLLEREAARAAYGPTSQRAVEELVKLLRERDVETLRHTYRTLFSRVVEPGEDVLRARDLVAQHFAPGVAAAG